MGIRKFSYIFLSILLFLFLLTPSVEARSTLEGLRQTAQKAELNSGNKGDINKFAGDIIGVGLSLIGVVFFILVVYGGIVYMTSHGNEEQAKRGRDTIIAASVGVILVLASYALTNFVLGALQGGSGGGGAPGGTGEVKTSCFCNDKQQGGKYFCANVAHQTDKEGCKFICYSDRKTNKSVSLSSNKCQDLPGCSGGGCKIIKGG
ncbi:MAG: pilin [Candidatus Magasanikbacteria bacterium]